MKEIIKLIRPHQWIKNLVVLFPIFFGRALGNIESLYEGCITVIAFSFIASSIYCLNDIIDVNDDRRHPQKCNRPLASGKISITQGYFLMVIMVIFVDGFRLFFIQLMHSNRWSYWFLLGFKRCLLFISKTTCYYRCLCCCIWFRITYSCRWLLQPIFD